MIDELKQFLRALDHRVFLAIGPYTSNGMTRVMDFISFFASHYFLLPANIFLAAWAFFLRKDRWLGWKIVVVSLGSVTLMYLLKLYFQRVRPLHPLRLAVSGYSFPSGHSMSAMTFYGVVMYLLVAALQQRNLRRTLYFFFPLLILAIGFSRIYLRVHYFSDVIGGFAFGYLWLTLSLFIMNRLEKHFKYENYR